MARVSIRLSWNFANIFFYFTEINLPGFPEEIPIFENNGHPEIWKRSLQKSLNSTRIIFARNFKIIFLRKVGKLVIGKV